MDTADSNDQTDPTEDTESVDPQPEEMSTDQSGGDPAPEDDPPVFAPTENTQALRDLQQNSATHRYQNKAIRRIGGA